MQPAIKLGYMLKLMEQVRRRKNIKKKIFSIKTSLSWLILICFASVLLGSSVATAVVVSSPVWSNVVSHQFTSQPWAGTVVASFPSVTSDIGQSITLSATLNPLPSQYQLQQNVTFYYSTAPIDVDGSGNAINQSELSYVGANQASSTVLTIAGVAQLTFTPQTTGTFYFIGEVQNPT